jgi:hypothetical protein
VTHAAEALAIVLLLNNLGQLLLQAILNELDEHVQVHFVVHNREAPFVLVADLHQSGEQQVLRLFVVKVGDREVAQLADDGTLSLAHKRLILFVVQTEVTDEQNGLVQQFFAVLLALCLGLDCVVEDVVEQVVELFLDLEVAQDLLSEAVVHAEDMI